MNLFGVYTMNFYKRNHQARSITVIAKEWYDRVNGNSYNAVRIYENGENGELLAVLPMEYGYGQHYIQRTREWLFSHYDDLKQHEKEREQGKACYLYDKDLFSMTILIERCLKREVLIHGGE